MGVIVSFNLLPVGRKLVVQTRVWLRFSPARKVLMYVCAINPDGTVKTHQRSDRSMIRKLSGSTRGADERVVNRSRALGFTQQAYKT